MQVSVWRLAAALAASVLSLACESGDVYSAAEIEAAVETHLAGRTDLRFDGMEIRADRIRYGGDRAVAEVSIIASGDPDAVMQMVYELERGPDGWRVVPADPVRSESPTAPSGHGVPPSLPPGHPPTDQLGTGLPPGHPPLNADPPL